MKIISKTLFLGWCMLPSLVAAEDGASSVTTIITPLGSSGKFRISDEGGASDKDSVVVEADYVSEILSDGSKSSMHQTPTMANQDFTISDPVDTTIGDGIPASLVTFSTTLVEKGGSAAYGTMEFDTYIIEESGTITSEDGSESFDVEEDDIKFNIRLSDWTWDTDSEYVDVSLIIKGKSDEAEEDEEEENKTFDLGGNIPLILSGRVVVDGTETDMPEGYPTYRKTGNKYTFIFRFPKFTDTAVYDPVVAYSQKGGCWSWLGLFAPALNLFGLGP